MFSISDIQVGYLLALTAPDGKVYYADVHHAAEYDGGDWSPSAAEGELICKTQYCREISWFPLTSLSDELTYKKKYSADVYSVDTIYGYALPPWARNCHPSGRRVLWQRDPPKAMSIDEVSAALGYEVVLIEDGARPVEPLSFPRRFIEDFMMVVLRNGDSRLIMRNSWNHQLVIDPANANASEELLHYDQDLRYYNHQMRELDIMEVWSNAENPLNMDTASRRIKWRRDERRHMTLDQICAALGYLVTIT